MSTVGGTAPYVYQWDINAGNVTTASVSNLPAGTYCVTTTDFQGCQYDTCIIIGEPIAPVLAAGGVSSNFNGSDISCFGLSYGQVFVLQVVAQVPFPLIGIMDQLRIPSQI